MNKCVKCYSYAINDGKNGRKRGVDTNLCDVCYWRKRAEASSARVEELESILFAIGHSMTSAWIEKYPNTTNPPREKWRQK